jgi:hypothetical protein
VVVSAAPNRIGAGHGRSNLRPLTDLPPGLPRSRRQIFSVSEIHLFHEEWPMRLSRFFITRPIFAAVIAVVITIIGAIAYLALPISQYPDIVPPTVTVTAGYPGASAETVAETVAAPIEQEINGVDDMLYQSSQSTGDGNVTITVTFKRAPISMPRRCWCRTASRSRCRACPKKCSASAS